MCGSTNLRSQPNGIVLECNICRNTFRTRGSNKRLWIASIGFLLLMALLVYFYLYWFQDNVFKGPS